LTPLSVTTGFEFPPSEPTVAAREKATVQELAGTACNGRAELDIAEIKVRLRRQRLRCMVSAG